MDESTNYDARMVGESRDSVDVLLVFVSSCLYFFFVAEMFQAGLFSAVVTTFVSQTSQSLQADYAQVSAALLFEIVLIQRAVANGSSLDNVPVSFLNPYTAFTPATTDVWVNGLWFTSLSLSLATAPGRRARETVAPPLPCASFRDASGAKSCSAISIRGISEVACSRHHWSSSRPHAPRTWDLFCRIGHIPGTAPTWPFLGHRHRHCRCVRDVFDNHLLTNSIPTMPLLDATVGSCILSLSLYYTGPVP